MNSLVNFHLGQLGSHKRRRFALEPSLQECLEVGERGLRGFSFFFRKDYRGTGCASRPLTRPHAKAGASSQIVQIENQYIADCESRFGLEHRLASAQEPPP